MLDIVELVMIVITGGLFGFSIGHSIEKRNWSLMFLGLGMVSMFWWLIYIL